MVTRHSPQTEPAPALAFHAVDAARWPHLERLFGARGGPKSCWCMVHRDLSAAGPRSEGADPRRREALAHFVHAGIPVGLLAYEDDEPVAWYSIAPKPTYRRLGPLADEAPESVWSLACFFVVRRLRGAGVMRRLIGAALVHAAAQGARVMEAYPVDPDAPSYRYGGFVETFRQAGFTEVGRLGTRRYVMRRALG